MAFDFGWDAGRDMSNGDMDNSALFGRIDSIVDNAVFAGGGVDFADEKTAWMIAGVSVAVAVAVAIWYGGKS